MTWATPPSAMQGREVLNRIHPGGFEHNRQSLRVVDVLEDGGLNLTWEVRDGIKCHPWRETPSTEEGRCVQLGDRIAYVNHDIDDAIRGGVLRPEDLPAESHPRPGQKLTAERINTLLGAVIGESLGKGLVSLSGDCLEALKILREFLFDRVYIDSRQEGGGQGQGSCRVYTITTHVILK